MKSAKKQVDAMESQMEFKDEIALADIVVMENNDSYIPESHFEFINEALKLSAEELRKAMQ